MGLLDDAIREHLELKRQHGADAGEIARQEHEALGPVRREDLAIPATPAAAAVPVVDDGYEYVDEEEWAGDDAVLEEAPAAHAPEAHEPEPAAFTPEPPAPADELAAPTEGGQPTVAFSLEELEAAGAAPTPPVTPAAPQPPVPTQDLSWDEPATPPPAAPPADVADDVVPADAEPGEHDELEETPEFLQETPEHDRLWFEQKPPRDFDF